MELSKEYKKLIIIKEGEIKRLEVQLEKQEFYKNVVGDDKIKDTRRQIALIKLEIQAIDKQVKKPATYRYHEDFEYHTCPTCGRNFKGKELESSYCDKCGQNLLFV